MKNSIEDKVYKECLKIVKQYLISNGHNVSLSRKEEMIRLYFKEKHNELLTDVNNYRRTLLTKMKEEYPIEVDEIRSKIRKDKKDFLHKKYGPKPSISRPAVEG